MPAPIERAHEHPDGRTRFHHLDAVRAGALLAGILLHAIMSFLPGFREASWPLADASTSPGLGILYFVIHLFRMSLFFLVVGFFARLLHARLGTHYLVKNRLRLNGRRYPRRHRAGAAPESPAGRVPGA